MAVLPDSWIKEMARKHQMIVPFAKGRVRKGKISYGVYSYGYDFRLANEFKLPQLQSKKYLDPKKMDQVEFLDISASHCLIPANSFILGRSFEYFKIPRDVLTVCQGKSTYARCGVFANVTPLEPEWEGFITISLINSSPRPVKVYSGEGIGQAIFIQAEISCELSYADRKGKYQAQRRIQVSRI